MIECSHKTKKLRNNIWRKLQRLDTGRSSFFLDPLWEIMPYSIPLRHFLGDFFSVKMQKYETLDITRHMILMTKGGDEEGIAPTQITWQVRPSARYRSEEISRGTKGRA